MAAFQLFIDVSDTDLKEIPTEMQREMVKQTGNDEIIHGYIFKRRQVSKRFLFLYTLFERNEVLKIRYIVVFSIAFNLLLIWFMKKKDITEALEKMNYISSWLRQIFSC